MKALFRIQSDALYHHHTQNYCNYDFNVCLSCHKVLDHFYSLMWLLWLLWLCGRLVWSCFKQFCDRYCKNNDRCQLKMSSLSLSSCGSVMVPHTSIQSSSRDKTTQRRSSCPPTLHLRFLLLQVSLCQYIQTFSTSTLRMMRNGWFFFFSLPVILSRTLFTWTCQQHSIRAVIPRRTQSWASCQPWSPEAFRLDLLVPLYSPPSDLRRGLQVRLTTDSLLNSLSLNVTKALVVRVVLVTTSESSLLVTDYVSFFIFF